MDTGPSPSKKFSNNYQAGALSFEFVSNGKKIITNSGYFNKNSNKLNELSRSSALHSVLVIDTPQGLACFIITTPIFLGKDFEIVKAA